MLIVKLHLFFSVLSVFFVVKYLKHEVKQL